jgi:uncharacterized membrane protein YjjP (DUF1212 family)
MHALFAPLARRRIWVTFIVVAIAGSLVGVLARHDTGMRVLEDVVVVVGLATLAAGLVAFSTQLEPDYRPVALEGLDRVQRKAVRHAVVAGDLSALDAAERKVAADFADAYLASVPRRTGPPLLLMLGSLLQSSAHLLRWQGDWLDWATAFLVVVVAVALVIGVPRQIRWLANARRVASTDTTAVGPPR